VGEQRIKLSAGQKHTIAQLGRRRADINQAVCDAAMAYRATVETAAKHLARIDGEVEQVAKAAIAEAAASGAKPPAGSIGIDGDEVVVQFPDAPPTDAGAAGDGAGRTDAQD
jgi:hypothetical protein